MFGWCAVCEGGDTWRKHLGFQWSPTSGLGTCCVRAFGEFDCVESCLLGIAVAGWVFALIEVVLVWRPVFVVVVAVVAENPAFFASSVLVVAQEFRCAWLRHQ